LTDILKSWLGMRILVVSPTPTHPQDHGNRKRIFRICQALKQQGAHIHFVHYAAEEEWRHDRGTCHERQMGAAWDSYDLVAPSRPPHAASVGRDHIIDEWADAGLSAFVAWVCRVDHFDVVLVNYTWLSFCLDVVPPGIFKILDTNDAFGHRRAMLDRIGVAPEFFHTTPEEEAKGLARADLVWAIKEQDKEYFARDLGIRHSLTVLHAEPAYELGCAPEAGDRFLRVGVVGARNNVNRRNLENFLEVALPLFQGFLADVKILIAGGCADDFSGMDHPNVKIIGRVPHTAAFYRSVDLVIAPIAASSGLQIKFAEALAAGVPLLALAHASEGYPTREPLHLLPDFEAMALALIELAFDPSRLPDLAERSRQLWSVVQSRVLAAIEQTRQMIIGRERRHICVVTQVAALDPASLLHDHLLAVLGFIRRTNPVVLYLTGPAAKPQSAIFDRFGRDLRVYADPALIDALKDQAPPRWSGVALDELFANRAFERAYFMADCRESLRGGVCMLQRAYVRYDAIELALGDADGLIEFLRTTVPLLLLSTDQRSADKWLGHYGVAAAGVVPFRQNEPSACLTVPVQEQTAARLLVLGAADDPMVPALQLYAARLGAGVDLLDPRDPEVAAALVYPGACGADPRGLIAGARLAVDLGSPGCLAAVLRESLRRLGIPVVTPVRGPQATYSLPELSPDSLLRLLRVVGLLLGDGQYAARQGEFTSRQAAAETADAGWYWLWRDLTGASNQGAGWEELLGVK